MSDTTSIVAETLRVHGELHAHEFDELVDHWAKLDHRLQPFEQRGIKLDLHIHDRDTLVSGCSSRRTSAAAPPWWRSTRRAVSTTA